jgi:hypothetical protein
MITKKSNSQISDKCDRLYIKASKFVTEVDDAGWDIHSPMPVKWSSKGRRLMRRAYRTADLMIDTQ